MTQTTDQAETLKKLYIELKKAKDKLRQMQEAQLEPIAVIGMGCRFPGGADDPEAFWELLKHGRDAVRDVPAERWEAGKYYDPDPNAPGKMYTVKGGFLTCGVQEFDASFFSISPKEARSLDPQQRLLLEVTWEALEDAGMDVFQLKGSQTGVFLGMSSNDYTQTQVHADNFDSINAYSLTGSTFSTAAGRISYTFGFEGPCITIDTACSSSFAALHYGIRSLRSAESDMVVVGGVNLLLIPEIHICFSKLQAISPDGKCKTFDAEANGYARGEGCGVVLIKRLSDAIKHKDRVLAVIRGSAMNQDGKSSGLTAPNGKAQEKVILQALKDAGLSPGDIHYIEAHGTGTSLGDPIEVEALGNAYKEGHSPGNPLLIGSVKTNIGHLEPAAGMSGLIKVIQALRHGAIPPSIHFKTPNPYIPWDMVPVELVTRLTSWKPDENGKKRRAGISTFGFSGTNVHVIVEEAPAAEHSTTDTEKGTRFLLTLSAKTNQALKELAGKYVRYLAADTPGIGDICYTSHVGRTHLQYRLAVDGETKEEIKNKLAAYCAGDPEDVVTGEEKENKKIVFLFTGQGAQYVGMGQDLYENHPVFREAIERCDELFRPLVDKSMKELLYTGGDGESVDQTIYTQPLIFTLQYALVELWKSWGIEASAVVGHSIGEFAAAVLTGVMSLEQAVHLAAARGRLMQAAPGNGAMGVIMADEKTVSALIAPYKHSLSIAAVNAEKNISISGDADTVNQVLEQAAKNGIKTRPLTVSHAFHSPLMDPILEEFAAIVSQVPFSGISPGMTYISSMTGKPADTNDINAEYWSRQIRETVRFYDAVKTLEANGYELFLEIGSAPILSSLGAQIVTDPRCLFIPSLRKGQKARAQVMSALGKLYTAGVSVDWLAVEVDARGRRQKVSLPSYPFQRQKYWTAPGRHREMLAAAEGIPGYHLLPGQKLTTPLLPNVILYQSFFTHQTPFFMQEHIISDQAISPAAAHVSMVVAAAAEMGIEKPRRFEQFEFISPLIGESTGTKMVQLAVENTPGPKKRFQILSKEMNPEDSRWEKHCSGFILGEGANQPPKHSLSIDELKKQCPTSMDISWFYENLWELGYHLGPGFQRIAEIWRGKNQGLFKMDFTNRGDIPGFSGYEIYPGFIDSVFQALVPTSDNCLDNMMHKKKIYIPISLSAFNYYRPLTETAWCFIRSEGSNLIIKGYCTLFNEQGEVMLDIEGLAVKQTDRDTLYGGKARNYHRMMFSLDWEEKNISPVGNLQTSGIGSCVIFLDQTGTGAKVAEALQQQQPGATCIRVLKDKKAGCRRTGENTYTMAPDSKEDFNRLFKELISLFDAAASPIPILYLWGIDADSGEINPRDPDPGKVQKETCGSLVNMIRALVELQLTGRAALWVITRDVQDIAGASQHLAVSQAPLWGLGRTVSLEYPELWGGLIDIDESVMNGGAAHILKEIAAAREEQVCLRGEGKRYAARLQRMEPMEPGQGEQPGTGGEIDPHGTYLITGGTGALGLLVARWLVQQRCGCVVLTARRSPTPEVQTLIHELNGNSNGSPNKTTVVVKQTDVSKPEEVARLIAEIQQTKPRLRGIFHAAGVLEDSTLAEQNWERFHRVFAPKVQGAWNLHRATREMNLDMFVMFSSASAWMGSPGQANYSAANEFLNALARLRRKMDLPGLSINWGPWAETGMAAARDNRGGRLSQQGIHSISPGNGINILQKLLVPGVVGPCLMVMDIDWGRYRLHVPYKRKIGLLSHFIAPPGDEKSSVTPPSQERTWLIELKNTPPSERYQVLLSHLRKLAGKIMGHDRAQQVDVNKPLAEQGMDSLMMVDIRNHLGEALGITLPVTLLYDHPTLEEVTRLLLEKTVSGTDTGEGEQPEQEMGKNKQTTSQLLEEIDALLEG